ncbi:MAG: helix-turn-helix domain-containing protein [Candidatus Kariarchaeaceae archaeon]
MIARDEAIAVFVMKVYLSVAEIADVTKKEKTTVLRWIKAGRFGNIRKVGNEYRVPHESFKKWWERRMRRSIPAEQQK